MKVWNQTVLVFKWQNVTISSDITGKKLKVLKDTNTWSPSINN